MKQQSKFSKLLKYIHKEELTPKENFLTELFAWTLQECPSIYSKLLMDYDVSIPENKFNIITQKYFDGFYIDMILFSDKINILFEIKWNSKQHKNQLKNYLQLCKKNKELKNEPSHLIYLTQFKEDIEDEVLNDSDFVAHFLWGDIYKISYSIFQDQYYSKPSHRLNAILSNFCSFLRENGLGEFEGFIPNDIVLIERDNQGSIEAKEEIWSKIQLFLEEITEELNHNFAEIDFKNGHPGENYICKQIQIGKNKELFQIRIYSHKTSLIEPKIFQGCFKGVPDEINLNGYRRSSSGYYFFKIMDKSKLCNFLNMTGEKQKEVIKNFVVTELKNIGFLRKGCEKITGDNV